MDAVKLVGGPNRSAHLSQTDGLDEKSSVGSNEHHDSNVPAKAHHVFRTHISPMGSYVETYRSVDFDFKFKNVGMHLGARIQAGVDSLIGAAFTVVAVVRLVARAVFSLGLLAITKVKDENTACKFQKFCGVTVSLEGRATILKYTAIGMGCSLFAVASPSRAIRFAGKW